MKLALAQINPTVGDLEGNTDRVLEFARRAEAQGAELVIFAELAISGYPPRDLVEVDAFLQGGEDQLERLADQTRDLNCGLIVGYAGHDLAAGPRKAGNCAAYVANGEVRFRQQKMLLPTYDVFDEQRHFSPATEQSVCEINDLRVGITICEDAWNDKQFWERSLYSRDPVEELVNAGVDLIINISASPYHLYKRCLRLEMIRAAARRHAVPVVMVNQVGGNDHLVFDGSSFAVNAAGTLVARADSFVEDLIFWETAEPNGSQVAAWPQQGSEDEHDAVYDALVLGTRDYVRKCGFSKAIIGLSGGIDSALTVLVATDALGPENVMGVAMPGPYSSEGSLIDARHTAESLGIRFEVLDINEAYSSFETKLAGVFAGTKQNTAEENLQARLRGNTLMALSNKFGGLVLTTGNKSELAVGYCTLYGDMCGGLAVISDVPKILVYALAHVANKRHPGAISEAVLTKPPSAELRPDQKDSDSLPPYELLDPILRLYVEENLEAAKIAEQLDAPLDLVTDITRKVDRNEYKRQQAAPGLRVTSKAFGLGRRFPIAQRFVR
jgi:NAD+ synthase (glutamine-hydrolysing)